VAGILLYGGFCGLPVKVGGQIVELSLMDQIEFLCEDYFGNPREMRRKQ
jgi:hypothetical protein